MNCKYLGLGRLDSNTQKMLAPLEEINLEDDIRQNIYHCLITEKGERALRPEYGCEISKYFYQLNKSGMARK